LAVGSIDLQHRHTLGGEEPGESRSPRAGAFHTDGHDATVTLEPRQHAAMASTGRGELGGVEQPAKVIDDGSDVHVSMRIDPSRHHGQICQAGHGHPFAGRGG
jgi:hypothetical protein